MAFYEDKKEHFPSVELFLFLVLVTASVTYLHLAVKYCQNLKVRTKDNGGTLRVFDMHLQCSVSLNCKLLDPFKYTFGKTCTLIKTICLSTYHHHKDTKDTKEEEEIYETRIT